MPAGRALHSYAFRHWAPGRVRFNARCAFGLPLGILHFTIQKPITRLWHIFKTYPVSVPFCLVYLFFAALTFSLGIRLKNMREPHLTLEEGLRYGYFFPILTGAFISLIKLLNWLARVKQREFYGWLWCLMVLLPVAVIIIGTI